MRSSSESSSGSSKSSSVKQQARQGTVREDVGRRGESQCIVPWHDLDNRCRGCIHVRDGAIGDDEQHAVNALRTGAPREPEKSHAAQTERRAVRETDGRA